LLVAVAGFTQTSTTAYRFVEIRRLSWSASASDFERRLGEQTAEPPRGGDVSLLFVQSHRLLQRRRRLPRPVREAKNLGKVGSRLRAEIEVIGARRDRRRVAREALGLLDIPAAG